MNGDNTNDFESQKNSIVWESPKLLRLDGIDSQGKAFAMTMEPSPDHANGPS